MNNPPKYAVLIETNGGGSQYIHFDYLSDAQLFASYFRKSIDCKSAELQVFVTFVGYQPYTDKITWGQRKFDAIKRCRQEHGYDLRTAIEWVEKNFPEFKG